MTSTEPSASKSPNCVSQGAPSIPSSSATLLVDDESSLPADAVKVDVSFSHVHLYVDAIENLDVYKQLEDQVNQLAEHINAGMHENANDVQIGDARLNVAKYRELYHRTIVSSGSTSKDSHANNDTPEESFAPQGRDVVKQLIAGLGFRITAQTTKCCHGTRSVLLTTKDPHGVQVVVTALTSSGGAAHSENAAKYDHFDSSHLARFFGAHSDRQGISVLAFEVTYGSIDTILRRYAALHPKLLMTNGKSAGKSVSNAVRIYKNKDGGITKMLEVYAYYEGEVRTSGADVGTVLRFIQRDDDDDDDDDNGENSPNATCTCTRTIPLPGLEPVEATFDPTSQAAYCDHWVSNVHSRTGFLDTLEDVLGFVPKVDFNAGVVAAGEAQIESTVTGNDSTFTTNDIEVALRDQSQVYLPINNALSEVGHVHGFLQEIGQGVQHVASRVADLPAFVQRGNDMRKITGEGFTFLNIPRSYYGVLMESHLVDGKSEILSPSCARTMMEVCRKTGIIGSDGAVNLDLTRQDIIKILDKKMPEKHQYEYIAGKEDIVDIILHSRYANLYSLLRDHLTEESYLKIVRNKILVDVQGEDLLLQIFSSNILQRNLGDEAPFFEFIQRVCSECRDETGCPAQIKPGCGGFGIRNFLTLFLSIEVSKAMVQASQAKACGDEERSAYAQRMVDLFTAQLNESNPILTEISNAMTLEGDVKMRLERAEKLGDEEAVNTLQAQLVQASKAKAGGNAKLMGCSSKYKEMMRTLRESRE